MFVFFFQAEDGIRDGHVTGVQTCALPISADEKGNLVYRKTARNFGPVMATAAKQTIVQIENIVPTGTLDPENIVTPSIYTDVMVAIETQSTALAARERRQGAN